MHNQRLSGKLSQFKRPREREGTTLHKLFNDFSKVSWNKKRVFAIWIIRDVWIYPSVYTHWNIPAERNIMAVYAPLEHIQTSNCAGGSAVRAAGQPAVWSACVLAGKIWQKNGHDMIWSWGAWSVCLYQKHEGQNACAFINMLCFRLEMKTLKHSFTSKYTKILYY